MIPLPIDEHLPQIVADLRKHRALVLVAEPGAGKTTRVPPAIIAANLLSAEHPNLVMLQPRRVAARAAAMRIADERGWALGNEVGYHVRFDRKIGPRTRLRVVTEGILSRQLLDDPFIEDVGCVVLDEFHERSLNTDMAIALLREVRQSVRDDLMLVVMSATLEAEPVAKFLGDCPIVRVPGRTFPVEIQHESAGAGRIVESVADAITRHVQATPGGGDVLVFLPGAEEIRRVGDQIGSFAERENLHIFPLYGALDVQQQMAALAPSRQRKIILATNIAETSLTIDGVRSVIDSGYARVAGYDAQRGLDRLDLQRISRASATQRAGRAGRTAPGTCIRLWSAKEDAELAPFELPEIRRVDLCGTVLSLHAWGQNDPRKFGWFESPDESMLASAERLLAMLGALSEDRGSITELGKRILSLPVHPRLASLLLFAAEENLAEDGAAMAALLSEKDIATNQPPGVGQDRSPRTQGASDLLLRLEMLQRADRERFSRSLFDDGIDANGARQVARARDQFLRIVESRRDAKPPFGSEPQGRRQATTRTGSQDKTSTEEKLLRLLLRAYPDRVCRRRGNDPLNGVMVGGGGVRLIRESVVTRGEFFLAIDARQDDRSFTRQSLVRIASRIEVAWLEELFPQSIRQERQAIFDEARQQVVGVRQVFYRDLMLREDRDVGVNPTEAGELLAEAIIPRAKEIIAAHEAAQNLLMRIALLRRAMPQHPWPAMDEKQIVEVIRDASRGKRSVKDVIETGLVAAIMSRIPYPMDRALAEHAPETIAVPTGNQIRLTYQLKDAAEGMIVPILAVRLQELFGLAETPRIAGGAVSVVLHLLGPNYRPVQITDDLRSFWHRTYPQVRKDLRARYPKHSWPEDPWTAQPQAKGTRRPPK